MWVTTLQAMLEARVVEQIQELVPLTTKCCDGSSCDADQSVKSLTLSFKRPKGVGLGASYLGLCEDRISS